MKKVFSALMAVVLVVGCLTGCSNKKAFEQSEIIRVLEKHGFEKADSYSDMYSNNRDGLYYVTEDEDEARRYASLNCSMKSVLNSNITENLEDEHWTTSLILFSFEESDDAEDQFYRWVDYLSDNYDVDFGEKDGYQYVCYAKIIKSHNVVSKGAAYLCGNNLLAIEGYCNEDGKTGFGNHIFKELGLVEPKVKD